MSDLEKRLLGRMHEVNLASFNKSINIENYFQREERKLNEAYSKYKQSIPWYLYPFKSKIERMLLQSFKDGKTEYGKKETVKIKRPHPYKTKKEIEE